MNQMYLCEILCFLCLRAHVRRNSSLSYESAPDNEVGWASGVVFELEFHIVSSYFWVGGLLFGLAAVLHDVLELTLRSKQVAAAVASEVIRRGFNILFWTHEFRLKFYVQLQHIKVWKSVGHTHWRAGVSSLELELTSVGKQSD